MVRSSGSQRAHRINEALELIERSESVSQAAEELAGRHDISKRQAYRYLREAKEVGKRVPIPDAKVAFTVKLSRKLVGRVRGYGKSTGLSLSEILTRALEAFLFKRGDRG